VAHNNFSNKLNDFVADKRGFSIGELTAGTLIDIQTARTRYAMVVVDPAKSEVAMTGSRTEFMDPKLWILQGSSAGGSCMKMQWIGVGLTFAMNRLSDGGLMQSSPVETFDFRDDPAEAKRITDAAEAKRPQVMTSKEEAAYGKKVKEVIALFVEKHFPESERLRIMEFIANFKNTNAAGSVLGVLSQGLKHGKFERAFELLEADWKNQWQFQPPHLAGDPDLMPMNAHRWAALWTNLGVPTPGEEKRAQ
jgi:hypothetical protein